MPEKDFDAKEGVRVGDEGDEGLAIWIGKGGGGCVLVDFRVNMRNIVANIDGVVAFAGSGSVFLV